MARGRKPKVMSEELRQNVFKRPDFLSDIPQRGDRARSIHMLSKKLQYCPGTECVIYTADEFRAKFKVNTNIKMTINYIKSQLKSVYKTIAKSYVAEDGRVYFWSNSR